MGKRALPKGDFCPSCASTATSHGFGGEDRGGRHVNANRVNKGIGMGNTGSTGMGRESIGFGINKTGGMKGPLVVVWKTWVTLYLG